jgi:hypothetical protein
VDQLVGVFVKIVLVSCLLTYVSTCTYRAAMENLSAVEKCR